MKNQVKRFGQFIGESKFDRMKQSNSPQKGDEVFLTGFAYEGGIALNAYVGYGTVYLVDRGSYEVRFDFICDAAGVSDNAPEEITFKDSDIVSGGNGSWAVHLPDMFNQ